jgi:signal transduction histidine kinase
MLRAIQLVLAAFLLVVAGLALVAQMTDPEAGVIMENPGGVVLEVIPGGPVWRSGIRSGDLVMALDGSEAPSGWRLVTTDGTMVRESLATTHNEIHRSFLGWAIAGLVIAAAVALLACRGLSVAGALLPLALAVVAQPLYFAGSLSTILAGGLTVFTAGGLATVAFPACGSPRSLRRRSSEAWLCRLVPIVGVALGLLWLASVLVAPQAFDLLDSLRWPIAIAYAGIGVWLVVDGTRLRALVLADRAPAFADVAYGSAVAAALLAAGLVARVDLPVLVIGAVAAIIAYPVWRRLALAAFDRLITADARRDSAIRAVEDERRRLAGEIHDAPLQELAGVIRQLEVLPEATPMTATLRTIAAHLREVATTLHPPVLQDLGLAAAIEDLVVLVREGSPHAEIRTELDDLPCDGRPPALVETAAYRITQEALVNAVRHSGASRITISGSVARTAIAIDVIDDGRGYAPADVRDAQRRGHFGLAASLERARSIGAVLEHAVSAGGVRVSFRWEGPS